MSKVCEICGKHPVAGRSVSHSHRVSIRKFRPNIQRVYVVVDGQRRKMNVCTSCLKSGKVARSYVLSRQPRVNMPIHRLRHELESHLRVAFLISCRSFLRSSCVRLIDY